MAKEEIGGAELAVHADDVLVEVIKGDSRNSSVRTSPAIPPTEGSALCQMRSGCQGAIPSVAASRGCDSRKELNVQVVVAAFAITVRPQ